jgi:hypothetical protein
LKISRLRQYMNDDQENGKERAQTGSPGSFLFLEIYQLRNRHFWSKQRGAPHWAKKRDRGQAHRQLQRLVTALLQLMDGSSRAAFAIQPQERPLPLGDWLGVPLLLAP